jgi:hypothetical protein
MALFAAKGVSLAVHTSQFLTLHLNANLFAASVCLAVFKVHA